MRVLLNAFSFAFFSVIKDVLIMCNTINTFNRYHKFNRVLNVIYQI